MRISVTQLRALFLVVNLVLAGGLAYKALAAYNVIDLVRGEDVEVEKHPARVDLEQFVYVPQDFGSQDPTAQVMRVSSDLQPPKPQPPKIEQPKLTDTTEDDEGGDTPTEEELPEGPLAEEWEYVYYIAWQGDSGARNFAQLRKKEDEASTSSRLRNIRSSSSRARTAAARRRISRRRTRTAKKADTVSFLVSDRRIRNEEFELDFWVHSADKEKLVYWMPGQPEGQPKKFYALPYKHEGSYLAQGPIRTELRPAEDEDEEDGEEEEEKKHFYIIHQDANPEATRERRYAEIVAGKGSESRFGVRSGKSSKLRAEGEPPGGSGGSSSSASKLRPSSRRPSKPTKEDIRELKSAIDKIPKAEQEKLRKELQGMLQGKKK